MRLIRVLLALLVYPVLVSCSKLESATNCGCECCKGKEVCCCHTTDTEAPEIKRHPLKGIVVDALPERGALLVKHEAIPGVMGAMTMVFKVDAATLQKTKKGDAISAMMLRKDDAWLLEDVRSAP